jgi:hypothetical protein
VSSVAVVHVGDIHVGVHVDGVTGRDAGAAEDVELPGIQAYRPSRGVFVKDFGFMKT